MNKLYKHIFSEMRFVFISIIPLIVISAAIASDISKPYENMFLFIAIGIFYLFMFTLSITLLMLHAVCTLEPKYKYLY